jgi:hypothetical protein
VAGGPEPSPLAPNFAVVALAALELSFEVFDEDSTFAITAFSGALSVFFGAFLNGLVLDYATRLRSLSWSTVSKAACRKIFIMLNKKPMQRALSFRC